MPTPDEVLEAVRANSTRTGSLITLFAQVKQELADALSGVTIPPAVQAKIDEIFDIERGDAQALDTALNANVPPPAPTP
jgi:hypothetical protein